MRDARGFSLLEVLIIVVVVCAVVAIGVPVLHRGANAAVLDTNLQSLGTLVGEHVTEGYSPEYKASGEGDPSVYLSSALEASLTAPGSGVYVNPFVGKNEGTAVVNSHTLPVGAGVVAPAVFITDANDCQYTAFPDLPLGLRRYLMGTLIVAFDAPGAMIDVYFVDQKGNGSLAVISVPSGPVRTSRHG